jgi:hypothetical protein
MLYIGVDEDANSGGSEDELDDEFLSKTKRQYSGRHPNE